MPPCAAFGRVTPDYLLAPTLGDGALKEATGGEGRGSRPVVQGSPGDSPSRQKTPDAAYWLDSADGMIVTSSCYRDSVHPWIADFNSKRVADQWFGQSWTKLRTNVDYEKYSGPDTVAGEGLGVKQGVAFPHPTDGGLEKPNRSYYDALFNSPFGNEMLFDLMHRAVVAERLGDDEITDLLVVSFSSNDAIGHSWGPDSQEVLDVTLRSDRMMAELLPFLDKQVGKGKYFLVISADHGICPLPEVTAQSGRFAKRIDAKKLLAGVEEHLSKLYDEEKPGETSSKPRWIEASDVLPWIYLNRELVERRKFDPADVAKAVADYLITQEGVYRTFTRADLAGQFPVNDPIGRAA